MYLGNNVEKAQKKLQKHIPIGSEFNFNWAVKDNSAKVDELKAERDPIAHLNADFHKEKLPHTAAALSPMFPGET